MKRFISIILAGAMIFGLNSTVLASEISEEGISVINEDEDCDIPADISEEALIYISEDTEFSAQAVAGGYVLDISADAGVFPDNTTVSVQRASTEREKEATDEILSFLEDGEEVLKGIMFDFEFADENGNVIEPCGNVNILINQNEELAAIMNESTDPMVRIFHISGDKIEAVDSFYANDAAEDGIGFNADEFSSYLLLITNNNTGDETAPVIEEASIEKANYTPGSGKTPSVTALITDNKSGVKRAYMKFVYASKGGSTTVELQKVKNDKWEADINVDGLEPGKYVLDTLFMADKAGNEISYEGSNIPYEVAGLSFTVVNKGHDFTAKVSSIYFDTDKYAFPTGVKSKSIGVSVKASYYSGNLSTVDMIMTKKNSDGTYSALKVPMKKDGSYFSGSVKIMNNNSYAGVWKPVKFVFTSTKGEVFIREYSSISKKIRNTSLTIYLSYTDKKAPEIDDIVFKPQRCDIDDASEKIKVTIKAHDNMTGISDAGLIISDGVRNLTMDNAKVSGNTVSGYITFPRNTVRGKYKIKSAFVRDKAENTRTYGSESGNTPLTKQMKKVRVEIGEEYYYYLSFDSNGGKGSMSGMDLEGYAEYKLPANKFRKKGYKFTSWNTKLSGKGKSYKNKEYVYNVAKNDGDRVTLYAQWRPIKYNIKFDANGGKGEMSVMKNIKYDSRKRLKRHMYLRSGYVFAGWNTKPDGTGKKYSDRQYVKNLTAKDKTTIVLYAQWKKSR